MKVDLSRYETVKERKKRFYSDFPDGSIIVSLINHDVLEHALFKAVIYKTKADQENNLPTSTGYAHEIRDNDLLTSKSGNKYASVNYTSWVENCEESAIGRALDNAGYAGNDKCSRNEIEKAKKHEEQFNKLQTKSESDTIKERLAKVELMAVYMGFREYVKKQNIHSVSDRNVFAGCLKNYLLSEIKTKGNDDDYKLAHNQKELKDLIDFFKTLGI